MNKKFMKLGVVILGGTILATSQIVFAGHHGEDHGHAYGKDHGKGNPHQVMPGEGKSAQHMHGGSSSGHMMDSKEMQQHMGNDNNGHMREVMGHGRINKIMAGHHMVNIKHAPMPEMNWPQMSMNFKTEKKVDLSSLKPGQEVKFTLLVDDDNNYVIKEITVK